VSAAAQRQGQIRGEGERDQDILLMAFNANLEVLTTKEVKVTSLVNYASLNNKKSVSVSKT
jgi:protein transport protein SEC23